MSSITVNVTKMFSTYAPNYVSASVAELGSDAGRITWGHALEIADERDSWLVSNVHEACDAIREWAFESGSWDEAEVDDWGPRECLALLAQNVASDLRGNFEQDCEVDTYAVTEAYEAMEEPECGCHYYRAEMPNSDELLADWYA